MAGTKKTVRLLLALPGIVLLAVLMITSARIIVADIYHWHAGQFLDYWHRQYSTQQASFSIAADDMQKAQRSAGRAMAMQPDDPRQLLQYAEIYQWKLLVESEPGEMHRDSLRALQLYRESIALRPIWPYGWMAFAEAKSRLQQIDYEFNHAIARAVMSGPWEPAVMQEAARLGFHYQAWLLPETRRIVNDNLERFTQRFPHRAVELARAYNRLASTCALLESAEKYRACQAK